MNSKIFLSVIVTTYNRPDALVAVLAALAHQTLTCFEVIVADDGSSPKTSKTIMNLQANVRYPLHHVWQEDQGFRAAAIRNKAVASAAGQYLIFLDGDCIPRPTFLAKHKYLAEKNYFVVGQRVLLTKAFTENALRLQLMLEKWTIKHWFFAWLKKYANKFLPFFEIPLGPFRKMATKKWQGAKSCNLGIWKKDFIAVNGFDESYAGWGYEDSDLVIRLIRAGIKRKQGRFAIPVIHLWHTENDRSKEKQNHEQLIQILEGSSTRANIGVDQYHDASC